MPRFKSLLFTLCLMSAVPIQAQTGKDVALETLGSASGLLLYNTYTTIGILADAYVAEAYDYEFAIQILDEQIYAMNEQKNQFTRLIESGFLDDPADLIFANEIIFAFDILTEEADALRSHISYPDLDDGSLFQEKREAAWNKIAFLLGIE